MIEGTLQSVAGATRGQFVGEDAAFNGVSTDTRSIAEGQLFVALKGPRFDAHDMLEAAVAAGAAGLVVMRQTHGPTPQIIVSDSRVALGDIARSWRRRTGIPVIAVTGSNGKTTTKEMLASILRTQGPTLATEGNLNNDIGVPLTLFRLDATHRHAVIEMGANRPHDISVLVDIAEPTVSLVTMCGPAHLEGLGDLAGVATTKGQIYSRLPPDGVAVINVDEPFTAQWRQTAGAVRFVTFGLNAPADVTASDIECGAIGSGTAFVLHAHGERCAVRMPFDGQHNVRNALAATAAAIAVGVPMSAIVVGLENAVKIKGRLNVKRSRGGMQLIDDSYNANPASLSAALALLAQQPNARWLVFGDMGELGAGALAAHREVGFEARRSGVDRLFGIGPQAREAVATFGAGGSWHPDALQALDELLHLDGADATVLVKGSRFMQLDRLVDGLVAATNPHGGKPEC